MKGENIQAKSDFQQMQLFDLMTSTSMGQSSSFQSKNVPLSIPPILVKTIDELDWHEFEKFCKTYFERRGFVVEMTPFERDGGIDLILWKEGHKALVQCKHHRSKIKIHQVREFFGVMSELKISTGFYVAKNGFTIDALKFCMRNRIRTIDKHVLKAYFQPSSERFITKDMIPGSKVIICPRCRRTMVLRNRKTGYGDSKFFGCSHYPQCRGIVSMAQAIQMGFVP